MTLRGQPGRKPLVACHHAPSAPARRNARHSCRYMDNRARSTLLSMPSTWAIRSTTACGMRSKHVTQSRLSPSSRHPLTRASSKRTWATVAASTPPPPPRPAETVGPRMHPGFLLAHDFPQTGPYPQPVGHGQNSGRVPKGPSSPALGMRDAYPWAITVGHFTGATDPSPQLA